MKTTEFLIDVLKRHERNEIAQKASMLELKIIRERFPKRKSDCTDSEFDPFSELQKLIESENITADQIM